MGDKITLDLEERSVHGKKVRSLRKTGLVPGVIYGQGFEPVPVQAVQQIIDKVYQAAGKHHPIHVTVAGKKRIAMIKDVDTDPVKHRIRHVSFHAVKANERIEAEVPVHLIGEGESAAEKAGLIVLQMIDSLEVKALPMELPDALEVSILELAEAGDRITVADIKLPENVELVDDIANQTEGDEEQHSITEQVVASVYEPSALQAANEAAGGDAEDETEVAADNGNDDSTDQTSADQTGTK